jgi:hypothetical protein
MLEHAVLVFQREWSVPQFPPLDSARTLLAIFAAPRFGCTPGPLTELLAAYPQATVIGCSTAGEICGSTLLDESIVCLVARFEQTRLRVVSAPAGRAADSFRAGVELAQELVAPDLRAVFVLSDGLVVNGSELARGLASLLPPEVVVAGGMAGDGPRFQQTWVLVQRQPRSGVATAVGFYGEALAVGAGSQAGWFSFGLERRVTRAQGNVLFELDGRPALAVYRDYLGAMAAGLPATALLFPLAIRRHWEDPNHIIRTVLAIDEENQAMVFAGDIPEGALAQMMRAKTDALIEAASVAAAGAALPGPGIALAVSCVGRRLVLGERTDEELEATCEALPPGTTQVGFYSYGEFASRRERGCDLQNETMTILTLAER